MSSLGEEETSGPQRVPFTMSHSVKVLLNANSVTAVACFVLLLPTCTVVALPLAAGGGTGRARITTVV